MNIKKLIGPPLLITGTTLGLGLIGQATESPHLQNAGATAGKFIVPAVAISTGGYLINEVKKIGKVL